MLASSSAISSGVLRSQAGTTMSGGWEMDTAFEFFRDRLLAWRTGALRCNGRMAAGQCCQTNQSNASAFPANMCYARECSTTCGTCARSHGKNTTLHVPSVTRSGQGPYSQASLAHALTASKPGVESELGRRRAHATVFSRVSRGVLAASAALPVIHCPLPDEELHCILHSTDQLLCHGTAA